MLWSNSFLHEYIKGRNLFLKQHFYAVLTFLLNYIWSFGVVRSRSWKSRILQIFERYYDFIEGCVRNKHSFKHDICQLKCVLELSYNDCLDNEQRTCYGIWQKWVLSNLHLPYTRMCMNDSYPFLRVDTKVEIDGER